MKTVFINRFFYPDHSATSQLLTDLAFNLAEKSYRVVVIASRQLYGDAESLLPSRENVRGVKICRVWSTRFGRGCLLGRTIDYATFYLSATVALFKHVRSGDVLVAKTDPPLISVVAAAVTTLTGARLINWTQDLFPEIASALKVAGVGLVEQRLKHLRNHALRVAFRNIVIGEHMAEYLRIEGVPAQSLRVIHNWADGSTIHPVAHDDNSLRTEWNLQGKFVVGYSGNFGRAHEFRTILASAEQLSSSSGIRFLFIGDGAQLPTLRREVDQRCLSNVLFQPYQPRERLSYSLSAADVHLISLHPAMEGLIVPSKFYGVAAAGRPTIFIGSKNGEISAILRSARCGYTVECGQANELSQIIQKLADHRDLCTSLGLRARAVFDQQFDTRHAMLAWESVLRSLNLEPSLWSPRVDH